MRRIEREDIRLFREDIVLRPFVFETAKRQLGANQELEQEPPDKSGLELEHVAVESARSISMAVDFQVKRSWASRVPALCISQ
jgi:hypothetical protein